MAKRRRSSKRRAASHRRRSPSQASAPRRRGRRRNPFQVIHEVRRVKARRGRRRHNPPTFGSARRMGGGILRKAWEGLKNGAAVEVGRIGVNKIPALIPVKNAAGLPMFSAGLPGMAAGAVTAVLLGVGADKVVRGSGAFVTAGGFSLLLESLLASAVAAGVAPKALSGYVPLAGYVPLSGIPGVDAMTPDAEYNPVQY